MATERVLKSLLWVLASPLSLASLILEKFAPSKFLADLERCLELTAQLGFSVPDVFVDAVILAEDHRSALHPGVDVFAMARSAWVRFRCGQIQGASTIEQQFVRVVTNRNERTFRRKVREQVLALMLVRRTPKRQIASAYLAIAFYGSGSVGLHGLWQRFGRDLEKVSFFQALDMVAQLKYPRPRRPNKKWNYKLAARIEALHSLGAVTASKSLQRTFDSHPIFLQKNGQQVKRS